MRFAAVFALVLAACSSAPPPAPEACRQTVDHYCRRIAGCQDTNDQGKDIARQACLRNVLPSAACDSATATGPSYDQCQGAIDGISCLAATTGPVAWPDACRGAIVYPDAGR